MNKYYDVATIADKLSSQYDWSHSFIRECYLASNRNLKDLADPRGDLKLGDVFGNYDARIVIACAGNADDTGIEFIFRDLVAYSIIQTVDTRFCYTYDKHSGHTIRFSDSMDAGELCFFTAKSVDVKFLGRSYQGHVFLLGQDFPSNNALIAISIDAKWRQCPNCSNVWSKCSTIEFSRCPECGILTRLSNGDK